MKNDEITKTTGALRTEDNMPDVRAMHAEIQDAVDGAVDRIANMQTDSDTRNCRWANQRTDGRKPDKVNGKPAEPWARSSDVRIRLADELVNDDVVLMKTAGRRANLTVKGTESGDMQRAGKTQIYLEHLRNTRIRRNVARESELAAQWRHTFGYAFMAVTWQREYERVYETVTLDQLTVAASQAGPDSPAALILAALYSPDKEVKKQLAGLLVQMYEDLDRGDAWRQLNALRVEGAMVLPGRNLRVNVPQWKALKPWKDLFAPVNTEVMQDARWLGWRRTFNEAQLREKALSEDWSEEWIAAVLRTEGKTVLDTMEHTEAVGDRRVNWRDESEEMDGLFEVFYLYYTAADENGVPCKYLTVMSPHVAPDGEDMPHGPDGPLDYEHGEYPFVECRRDRTESQIVESRGVPSLVATQQGEVKHARDSRVNATDLFLQPPVLRPEREVGLPLTFRPRGEIGFRKMEQTKFMPVPNTAPAGSPLEADARLDAMRYFARNRTEDPMRVASYEQMLADDWCEELAECWSMTLQLAQQFESALTFARKVGGKQVQWTVSREEIQGKYDLQLFYNTENADPEKVAAKTKRLQVYQQMDRFGILNLAPVVGGMFARDFPEFADEVVQSLEQAGMKEIEDEQKNWALMAAGEEPVMHENGQNFAMRLQWLTAKTQQPGAQARLAAWPDMAELVAKRIEHFTFMLQQQVNANTGAVGVEAAGAAGV
ncbi:MAG: hypothetical protein WC205_04215 [Opitutaceae bacterium]|jgi:hypothetical protein